MVGAERCKKRGDAGDGFTDEFEVRWTVSKKDRSDRLELT
jgi:hypothetical protein